MASVSNVLSLVLSVCLLPVVVAQTADSSQCTINTEVVVANATVRFGLILSLRKNDQSSSSGNSYTCSLLSREPLQNFLAVEWVVDRLNKANNGTGYIPGVTLGFYGMDDCRSAVYSSRNALSFLNSWVPTNVKACGQSNQDALHIGLIGPSRSSTATRVASLLRDVPVPIISMSATSAELSNTGDYPTFFRTVPSDDHQVNMIVQILQQMSWTYVAVVYTNDDYGTSAATKLSELAARNGICIFKKIPIGDDTSSYTAELPVLIKAVKGNSIAIPFIGTRDSAENLLYSLNKLARVDGREVKYGFHLILSESSNTDVTIYATKDIGVGTLSVGGSNIFLDDLYADLTNKVQRVKSGAEKHQLIEQYNRENTNNDLIIPNTLDTFVPLSVHAVFALAEALKAEHNDACNGNPGVCSALKANVAKGNILKQVKNVTVDYRLMESGVPPNKFRENNYTLSFDANGDIKLVNKNPIYSIYQYRGGAGKKYEQIGTYTDGQTILEMDKMKFLTPSGQPSPSLSTSVCSSSCADCLSDNIIPTIYLEGEVYILGVFSIHETSSSNPFRCGDFRSLGNDVVAAEGFLFAVKELRTITGVKFGAIAIDDCYSPLRSTTILSHYFSSLLNSDVSDFTHYVPREKLAGVVACRSSGCTISTAHFFMPMKIPVVSYSASSPDLDSEIDFPYFLRTVPSDVYQAQVMLELVKTMGWEYIGLLYVKNNYGAKGIEAFKNIIMKEGSRVCIGSEQGINEIDSGSDGSDFRNIYTQFINQNVKVVIFFGIDVRFRSFLSFLEIGQYYGKFIFIGSEDWGVNQGIYNSGQKSARGSLTLKVQDIQLENYSQFKEHLASKIPSTNDTNIWFTEFWQYEFNCNLKGGFINTFGRDCDPSQKLSEEQLDRRAGEQRVTQVINAVYALGKGLAKAKTKFCEDQFPCNYFRQNADQVVNIIKEQTRQQGNLKFNIFDSNGNGALGFDIYNIQQNTADGNPYVMVGTSRAGGNWGPNDFQKEKLKFYDEAGNIIREGITAKCSETLCQHCPVAKIPDPVENKESYSSVPEYRQSDILLISLIVVLILAILVAILAIIVFFTRKYKGLKKQIQSCKEEIYDEPDRIVYQPYTDTHGIRFANGMNPYPIMSSVGLNNGDSSASDINGGVNNLAFVPEFDSVSQAMSLRNRQRTSPSDLQSQTRNDPISLVSTGQYVSPYSSRPLPVSPIGSDLVHRRMQGNQAYVDTRSENSKRAIPGSLNDQSNMRRASDLQSLTGGQICLLTSSSLRGRDVNESDIPEGIVYYMQGPNGQLAPHISSLPVERGALIQQMQQPLQTQNSVRSQHSSTTSSVNPSYGPYSTAAVQRMRTSQHPQQQFSNNNNHASPLVYGNSSTVNHNENTSVPNSRPKKPNINQAFTDHEVDNSPIHFANPSGGTGTPVPIALPTSHYQTPSSHTNHQQHIQTYPTYSTVTAAVANDNFESTQNNYQYSDTEPSLQELDGSQVSPDRSPDQSRHSMISSSIPDVVGQSSPALELERQASLESVNLSSSKESLDDLNTEVKNPGAKKNSNGILSALSALSGNISRV